MTQPIPPHEHAPGVGLHVQHVLDGSDTIRVGGTAQRLFDAPVRGYEVLNPDATNDLWVSDMGHPCVANGVGCIRVAANGGGYWTPVHTPPLWQEVFIVGAVTGQAFTARYW